MRTFDGVCMQADSISFRVGLQCKPPVRRLDDIAPGTGVPPLTRRSRLHSPRGLHHDRLYSVRHDQRGKGVWWNRTERAGLSGRAALGERKPHPGPVFWPGLEHAPDEAGHRERVLTVDDSSERPTLPVRDGLPEAGGLAGVKRPEGKPRKTAGFRSDRYRAHQRRSRYKRLR
jgi:hypothetical protein